MLCGCEIPAGNTGIVWCEVMPEMEPLRYLLAPLHFYPLFPSGSFPFQLLLLFPLYFLSHGSFNLYIRIFLEISGQFWHFSQQKSVKQ